MGLFGNIFGGSGNYDPPSYFNVESEKEHRLHRYKRTWEAYLAELPDPIVVDGPSNDNVKVNPARAIINTGVYFLFGSEIKFQVSPDSAERYGDIAVNNDPNIATPVVPTTPAWLQDLNRVWKANRKNSFFHNLGLSGAIHGNPFIKIVPNAAGLNNEFPRLDLLDPANVDVTWDPNDCSRVLQYCIEYVTENDQGEPVLRIQEITADVDPSTNATTSWTMQDYEQPMGYVTNVGYVPAPGERQPVGPAVIWPYAWAPIESCQNIELPHMFWGLPDLDESSVEVIESLQRSMSSMNKIVRIHASPRMFAKNVMPDQIDDIDVSADNIITLPNMEASLEVLNSLTNLSPSIQYAEKQRELLLEMVQVPAIALGEFNTASTSISGVTLSILYAPLLQKTELKRISYGDMVERLNSKILTLLGYSADEYESLIIVWPEAMPGSSYLERQTFQQDHQMGASKYTVMARLGYDPKEEEDRRIAEQQRELAAVMDIEQQYNLQAQSRLDVGGAPQAGGTQVSLAPAPPQQQETRGGNNNPSGFGNKNGSLGGTKAAGTPKNPRK